MTSFEKDVAALKRRYQSDVSDLGRAARGLPSAERALSRVHANVKEACANELDRLLRQHGVVA